MSNRKEEPRYYHNIQCLKNTKSIAKQYIPKLLITHYSLLIQNHKESSL